MNNVNVEVPGCAITRGQENGENVLLQLREEDAFKVVLRIIPQLSPELIGKVIEQAESCKRELEALLDSE